MKKSVIKSAKTVEEAVNLALTELDTTKDKVNIDVIEEPSSGFLGILGVKPAIVKVVEKEDNEKNKRKPKIIKDEEIVVKETKEPKEESKPKKEPKKEIKPKNIEKEIAKSKEEEQEEFDVVEFLQKICDHIMPGCEVSKSFEDKDEINLEIEGDNLGLIVGKHGETLNAIQYVTAMVFNNNIKNYKRVNVDAGGYRKRREEKLIEFSMKMANKVKDTGRRISLEPMNSYERRIVHIALQDVDGTNTFSEGREPNRKVVITSTKKKSNKNKSESSNKKEKQSYKDQRAKEERRYKALEKQHEQLNGENETNNSNQEEDNPYEHYYSKYDNRIKKK